MSSYYIHTDKYSPKRYVLKFHTQMVRTPRGGPHSDWLLFFTFPFLLLTFLFSLCHLAFRLRFRFLFFTFPFSFLTVLIFASPFCFSVEISVFIYFILFFTVPFLFQILFIFTDLFRFTFQFLFLFLNYMLKTKTKT